MTARILDGQVVELPAAVQEKVQNISTIANSDAALAARVGAERMARWLMEPVCEVCGPIPLDGCACDSGPNTITRAEYEHRKQLIDRKVSDV